MKIVFDPPIGHAVHVGVSSLIAKIRPTVLLFTARISQRDYDRLVKDKGRVQLWSDIPHDEAVGGGWHQLDFQESARDMPLTDKDTRIISLNGPPIRPVGEDKILCLAVRLPAGISSLLRFQFTYRIAYPGEQVLWMGQYRQNGSVILDDLGSKPTHGLLLEDGWSWSETKRAGVFETEERDNDVEVMRIENGLDYRLVGLGKQSILSDLEDASLLLFIPRTQPYLTLRSTYILSTSPGSLITVKPNGVVALSGTGTALLEAHDMQSNSCLFFERILKHCELAAWKTIRSDNDFQTVLLASTGPSHPRSGLTIPLWPSEHLVRPLRILQHSLVQVSSFDVQQQLAIFAPYNLKIYLLDETNTNSDLTLLFDATNSEFILSPVYRLRSPPGEVSKFLSATILTPHRIVPAPSSPLPTPPPSPPPSSAGRVWAPVDTDAISAEDPPSDEEPPVETPSPTAQTSTPSTTSRSLALVRQAQSQSVIVWLVRSLLVSMSMFWHILLRILELNVPGLASIRNHSRSTHTNEDETLLMPDQSASDNEQDQPQFQVEDLSLDDTTRELEDSERHSESNLTESAPSFSTKKQSSIHGLPSGQEMIFVELRPNPERMETNRSPTTSTIALFAPDSFGKSKEAHLSEIPPLNDENIEHAVRFLERSTMSQPECSVSKCEIVEQDRRDRHGGSLSNPSGVLLEFQLEWDIGQTGKTVRVSVPPDLV